MFLVATVALFATRRTEAPYNPGRDAGANAEITRSLDRSGVASPPAGRAAPALSAAPPGSRIGAERGGETASAAEAGPPPASLRFTEVAESVGLRFTHFHGIRSTQLPEDMGSGLAWGDYDGDGWPDLFVVNESGPLTASAEEIAASPAHARLFHNEHGRFTDATDAAGVAVRGLGMGAAWGDYDGDGRLDLFVTRYGRSVLFRNEGGGRFRDVSRETGVDRFEGFWTGASWADYDRDGRLDLYVCGYVRYSYDPAKASETTRQFKAPVPFTLNPSSYPPERNLLLHNVGGRFVDVAREAGVDDTAGRSLSASWVDFDGDGQPDLYVANDVSNNALFLNLGNGRFRDVAPQAWVNEYRGSMGLGIGDWNNEGRFDIFITHWLAQENALYHDETPNMKVTPEAPLRFVDQADILGLGQIALDVVGWGAGFFDFDNDGRLDLYAVNGSTLQDEADPSKLVPMRSFLFRNEGEQGFVEVGAQAGEPFATPFVGRGASAADFDGDGDLDVAVVAFGDRLRFGRNDGGSRRGWLRLVLRGAAGRGPGPRSTTFATGARVRLTTPAGTQMREVGGQSSYESQEPPGEVFFGTGDAAGVEKLEVRWPSGRVQSFENLPSRATVEIAEGGAPRARRPAR